MNPSALLLIDIGNTRIKWAVAPLPSTGSLNRLPHVTGAMDTKATTSAKIAALAKKYPKHYLVLTSVVPKLTPLFTRAFKGRVHVVTATSPALGLEFDYPKPAELGTDRLVAAVAVAAEGKFPAIIISAGTATAISALDAKGRFCGGAIAPGLQAQLDALLGATAQLPATTLRMPRTLPARSTQDAIRAGLLLGYHGGVAEMVRQVSRSLGTKRPRIILTGGDAKVLARSLPGPHTLRPLLIFEGLLIIGSRLFRAKSL